MTFFVEKKLALGPIRFSVGRRRAAETIDESPELSTGPTGEFVRRRKEGFYFGGHDRVTTPTLPELPSVRGTPFWESLTERRGLVALAGIGAFFILLGMAVLMTKGAQGLVEIIIGIVLVAVPVVLTANKRRQLQAEEDRKRAEREAAENRNRDMLSAYTAALERVRTDRSDEALQRLVDEHPDLPYKVWCPMARRTTLLIGFEELAKHGIAGSREVAAIMDRVSASAGLTPEHATAAKVDLYSALVWHLLADDRFGRVQQEQLAIIRNNFGITENDIPDEMHAIAQLERLRAVTSNNLPREQCNAQLGFKEYCVHQTQTDHGLLHVTSKQLLVDAKKKSQHALSSLSEVTVYPDDRSVTMRDASTKKPVTFVVENPLYTAAMIDLASSIDERPRSFE
jgi:cell division protein FtsL